MGYLKSVDTSNGSTTGTVRVDRDAHTILVRRMVAIGLGARLRTHAPEIVSASIRNHNGGLFDNIKRATLGDLAAYAQYGQGPIIEIYCDAAGVVGAAERSGLPSVASADNGSAILQGGMYVTVFPIKLTQDGVCVAVGTDDDFVFEFSNLFPNAVYDFFALEGEQTGTNLLRYDNINILDGQHQRDLDVDAVTGLVIPAVNSFKRLLLTFANGRIAKYTIQELKYLSAQQDINTVHSLQFVNGGVVTVIDGPSTSETLVMPLHNIKHIELDTDGTAQQFLSATNVSRMAVN